MAGVGMMLMISLVIFGLGLFVFLTFSRVSGWDGRQGNAAGRKSAVHRDGWRRSGTFTFSMGSPASPLPMADVCGSSRGSRFIGAQFAPRACSPERPYCCWQEC